MNDVQPELLRCLPTVPAGNRTPAAGYKLPVDEKANKT
jgi:hypothetical protein